MPTGELQANIYNQDSSFWQKYLKGRPKVPDKLFERLFTYHAEHGGHFGTVHDAGAGIGVHSERLAKAFDHVLVTDAGADNIRIAQERLSTDQKYEFKLAKLEETISLPPASIDMVFAGVMIHFTELDQAIAAVAHQLKPGGTFVVAGWGIAILDDPHTQTIWLKLFQKISEQYLAKLGPGERQGYLKALCNSASSYDAVPIPEEYFEAGALRIKLNLPDDTTWYRHLVPPAMEEVCPFWSQVGPADISIRETESGWDFEMTLSELRNIVESYPSIDLDSGDLSGTWQRFTNFVGDRTVKGYWPATLILATRK